MMRNATSKKKKSIGNRLGYLPKIRARFRISERVTDGKPGIVRQRSTQKNFLRNSRSTQGKPRKSPATRALSDG